MFDPISFSKIAAGAGDMLLSAVQTISGLKTFEKDKMAMKGTGTGKNVVSVANTSANNYTNTIPAKDGTFAMTADITSITDLKQVVNAGICQEQYLTENDIIIDCVSATPTLTIATVKNGTAITALNPICFYTDGNGIATKHILTVAQSVNFEYTTGVWYFYFDNTGTLTASQDAWVDFSNIAAVYRLYLNSTLTGQARCAVESIEMHKNDISWSAHAALHADGTRWITGGEIVSNISVSNNSGVPNSSPNANGANTVVSLTTLKNQDDNMPYTVTNSTNATLKFNQNLGHLTAGTLTALNSGLFKVRINDSSGRLFFLPATRFPFPWDSATNRPEYITASGVRTLVTDNRWFVTYIYALQDPRNGESVKVVSEITDYTSYINAQSSSWEGIKSLYPTIRDNEIRPLYKLTFYNNNSGGAYDAGCKYSALIRIDDLRTTKVSSVSAGSGNTLASSTSFVPYNNVKSTNVQSAIQEVSDELQGYETTVSASATTVLDAYSKRYQFITGSTTHTFTMPVTSTVYLGRTYEFINNSSSSVTINSSGGNEVQVITAGTRAKITCVGIASTGATDWDVVTLTNKTSVNVTGYSVLGANSIAMQFKTLTGTTASTEGGSASVVHGLTGGKIISISVIVQNATDNGVSQEYTGIAGYQFHTFFDPTSVNVVNHATNSENILSKPFVVTIIFQA